MTAPTVARAPEQELPEVGMFVSHKLVSEGGVARFIRTELEPTAPRLKVHISEDIPAGEPWLEGIKTRLNASQVLLLLFTDPTADWDWCLFEAGYFAGLSRRIVCLHHEHNPPPPQLSHLKTVPATARDIETFIQSLFTTTDFFPGPAIAPGNTEQWRKEFGEKLATRIVSKHSLPLLPRLVIEVKDGDRWDENSIPARARIVDPGPNVLKLFNVFHKPLAGLRWQDLQNYALKAPDSQWLKDLSESIYSVHSNNQPGEPRQSVYRLPGQVRTAYRAQLSRVDHFSDRTERFHVVFVQEPTLTRTVTSFSDLMGQLHELFEYTEEEDKVYWLAYTPALGFLARKPEEWKRLERIMTKHAKQMDIVCLGPEELARWHSLFEQRVTDRGPVDTNLVQAATKVSKKLLAKTANCSYVSFRLLPEYYLFSNRRRAIAVTPFFLPRLSDEKGNETPGVADTPNVEMCGIVTQDKVMVDQARRVHVIVSGRRQSAHQAPTSNRQPSASKELGGGIP